MDKVAIPGYEGFYEVDINGNVFSMRTDKFLKPYEKNGYLAVNLYKNGKVKHFYIHRLVARAFIPNREGKREVNHLDCNKKNNSIENLEWCDRSQNVKHTYDVGGRLSNRETHIGNSYRSMAIKIIESDQELTFESMKDASIYLGKYPSYVSERFRRTGNNIIIVDGKRVMLNE